MGAARGWRTLVPQGLGPTLWGPPRDLYSPWDASLSATARDVVSCFCKGPPARSRLCVC